MAVEDPRMRVGGDQHEESRAIWIKTNACNAGAYGVNSRPDGSREVDTRMYVMTWAERVIWLQVKARAAKTLSYDCTYDDTRQGQALVARNLRRGDNPDHRPANNHGEDT